MAYITRELELYIPKREDLWFYQQMMADPETMAYNAGWDCLCGLPSGHRLHRLPGQGACRLVR